MLHHLTFILGGAASGKSAYAEGLVISTGRPRTYIATAQPFDAEMRRKIADHRSARGPDWTTVEAPLDPTAALAAQVPAGIVLLDCVTLWLTNVLLADRDVELACHGLLAALTACPCPVVVVSNEVGQGIVPDTALSRRFRTAQGHLNQRLARQADRVVAVMAGLPLALKGDLP
ncbi:adenosylcobinamide kinase /adenosylcobinamide-phosphate guanylyltransferase [Loktanella atrilutea]|uniref:Bifunctional adenosylcobalamin biosynthesis protein n=1 Tax=Loktanella atrilutea TaxID=366533 RepID=A0A1M4ZVN5_LOKAT|nr:bifunctional adenosylcobinamide kinase/adenosylcobinamide-phosphate guanylyltransferase [Loktanella atrilutea]SHF22035.1 adenosylcobinamide kinase /adenosylcobinamide-phosphate guanylyltransferase [Loktanella atrilutea]